MKQLTKQFKDITLADLPLVGGKNASLGEMFSKLGSKGVAVPDGFATTADAFWLFLDENSLRAPLGQLMSELDKKTFANLKDVGAKARTLLLQAQLPGTVKDAILLSFRELCGGEQKAFAVRSSATAEDLPEASFAGQHESFLNIRSEVELLEAVQKCFASLYTDRAIKYREDNGFAHEKVALSVGVQAMVRSDKSCSGVAFTLEPESGFRDAIHISGVWGLGENLVQGTVTPDEFILFKPTLRQGKDAILQHRLGDKALMMVYGEKNEAAATKNISTPLHLQQQFVLKDSEVTKLARWCLLIEEHYGKPMDIEWAKDGITGKLFILQARPETVQSSKNAAMYEEYQLAEKGKVCCSGQAIGSKIAAGKAKILSSPTQADRVEAGDIIITDVTSPDWDPLLTKAAAIVTNKGGRTSHASIVAREIGIPAVVGCTNATEKISNGEWITVSCAEGKTGFVYEGKLPFEKKTVDFSAVKKPKQTEVMLIMADPEKAFKLAAYPNDGVGLMRLEFIINHAVRVHPVALARFATLQDAEAKNQIERITQNYPDKKKYFVEKLSEGIATIAAAFYPKDVIVRMSDFKTNEYAHLIGGSAFEPEEENAMLGFRGASRYYHSLYKDGFALECAAVKRVREDMGLTNVKLMIPFCRTIEEGEKVIAVMAQNGLDREEDETLEIYMMAEIPSNVLLAEKFAALFDGFSIGSNDLTQLTLGIDRDSSIIQGLFSERNEAAQMMIGMMIEKAVAAGVKIGLCGQAPSDDPDFARFLVQKGINSISFNPDALLKGIENIVDAEQKLIKPQTALRVVS